MFFEHYRLERNPFARDGVRPVFTSHSARQAVLKVDELIAGSVHCLFLSGPAGVGKSTLVGRRLDDSRAAEVSWIRPGLESRAALLAQLISDLGPGQVEGGGAELRNILEVFLRHQAAKGERGVVVADGLERLSVPVLRELEAVAQLRFKFRPLLHFIMITRNDELVANLMPRADGGRYARAVHQPLVGFTLDETNLYLNACLQGAGCDWPEELFPPDVVTDIQAFTRGVVGDVNALCCEVLNVLAAQQGSASRAPRVTRAMLKDAGARLHLRYDPGAWEQAEEALSPEAVHLSDHSALAMEPPRLVVSSGGRTVTEISLTRPRMVLGRDLSCDIGLDSSYVSRYQNLFMETDDGWMLIDLNSTNGCFVNGRRVREHRLRDGDLIAVGQHQLRFSDLADRNTAGSARPEAPSNAETALSPKPVLGRRDEHGSQPGRIGSRTSS